MTRLASDDPHRVHAIVALAGAEDEEELAELLGGRVMTPESPRTTFHQIRRQRADLVATMALLDEAATPERVHEGLRDAYDGLSKALYAYDALRVDMIARERHG